MVLLPVERVLEGGGPRYTGAEVAERVGIDLGQLRFLRQAIGLPMPEEGEAGFTEADVEAARRVKSLVDAGLPVDELLEVTRAMGVAMSQVSAASRGLVGRAMVHRGDTELDVARRYLGAAQALRPLMAPTLGYMFDLHLREQLRGEVFGRDELHLRTGGIASRWRPASPTSSASRASARPWTRRTWERWSAGLASWRLRSRSRRCGW